MKAVISKTRTNEKAFAVMLQEAPEFPDAQPFKPIDVQRLIVIAANDDTGAWGWVNLDKDEKDCIGQALLDYDAGLNGWYWCELLKVQGSESKAEKAVDYMLRRLQEDARLAYLVCPMSEAYDLLTEAAAEMDGVGVEAFRLDFEKTLKFQKLPRLD